MSRFTSVKVDTLHLQKLEKWKDEGKANQEDNSLATVEELVVGQHRLNVILHKLLEAIQDISFVSSKPYSQQDRANEGEY